MRHAAGKACKLQPKYQITYNALPYYEQAFWLINTHCEIT